jgi:iron complex transport system ATP-binding protein
MKDGQIHAEGIPAEVITAANIKEVYGAQNFVYPHPINNLPVVLPSANHKKSNGNKGKEG